MQKIVVCLVLAGCSHVTRRQAEATSTATVTAESHREATATTATTTTSEARRTVRTRRTYTPRADGGFESVEELEELLTSDGKVSGETKEQEHAAVKAAAATHEEAKEVVKTGRPWWAWPIWGITAVVAALLLFLLWSLRTMRRI